MSDTIFDSALITGAKGMVGSYVDFGVRTDHSMLDVTDEQAVLGFCEREKPKLIIHLAAATDLARCESDPEYAYRVNETGTRNVARAAKKFGALMVYVSTSAVFNGEKTEPYTETDEPQPLSVYGLSKLKGERAVQEECDEYIIARIAWVFGGGPGIDTKFVAKVLDRTNQPVIQAVSDLRASPSYGKDVVQGIVELVKRGERGIVHLSNSGVASRADEVRLILDVVRSNARVEEVSASQFPTTYPIGTNESMVSRVSIMRPWQEALTEYLQEEWADRIVNKA